MKLIPDPSPLIQHRPGVWLKESWLRFSGMTLQTRMVLLETRDGLALYSPSPANPCDEILNEIRRVGEPRFLIAPNEIHNVGLASFQSAFPNTHTTGCVGHEKRVKNVKFDLLLGDDDDVVPPWTQSGDLRFHVIGGNRLLHEIAVLHVPSRTLVLTDAVECVDPHQHLHGKPPGSLLTWSMKLMGLRYNTPCVSPEHFGLCSDVDALEASGQVLESWDFDSLVIAHGNLFEGDEARQAVREAFGTAVSTIRARGPFSRALWGVISRLA